MHKTLQPLAALFISCFIFFLGNGLINVLLPVRMGLDGVNVETIGIVLSLYYLGMFVGAIYGKTLIKRSGHIRMFAGCVALAAVSILLCSLYSDPVLWGAMRIMIGFCTACALIAVESWLSDSSDIDTRGKVLATYNAVVLAGLFGGQFLMNIADPIDTSLFVVAGILLCAATIPIGLSEKSGPVIETVDSMPLPKLFAMSPLGVVSCVVSGIIYSALFNLLPVFAAQYGIAEFQLSLYMGAAIFGAFILQFPVGYLSDRFDRRTVLFVLLVVSAITGLSIVTFAELGYFSALFIATGLSSGIVACIYPLSIAEAFDRLRQSEMVAAMGSMILAFSFGGILGPFIASIAMTRFGGAALFYMLAVVQILLAGFVIYRMTARHALPIEDQESFVMQNPAVPPSVDLDPRTEYLEQVPEQSAEEEIAVTIAKVDPVAALKMVQALSINNPQLAVGMAAAIAAVEKIDVLRLFDEMVVNLPARILDITRALVIARPESAYELMGRLGDLRPASVVDIAQELGHDVPELRVVTAKAAMEVAPESAFEMAEYYAQLLAEEHESVRPAERDEDNSEELALNISAELWNGAADQALDVAVAMVDAIPESSVSVAEEYIASNAGLTDGESYEFSKAELETSPSGDDVSELESDEAEVEYKDTVELVTRFADAAPLQAMDMAVAVASAVPGSTVEIASAMAGSLSTEDSSTEKELESSKVDDPVEHDEMVELVQRLTEVSPDNAMDVAVAVVEQVPESAAKVATEYVINLSEDRPGSELDHDEAVELVNRLTDVSPDNAMDVAVAVVEVIPESASEVVEAISQGDEPADGEWMNSISDKPEG